MGYFNPDGSVNAAPSDGSGYYNKDGSIAITVKNQADLSSYAKTSDVNAIAAMMQATIPTPGTIPPPEVGITGSLGTQVAKYALSDHTHVSSVFKAIKLTTDATGVINWIYPANFFTDAPVIQLTVETTSGQPMTANLTSNTATGGSALLLRATMLPSSIVTVTALVSFNVYSGTVPVGTRLHIFAGKASSV